MKKSLKLFLVVCLLAIVAITLVGCGEKAENETKKNEVKTEEIETETSNTEISRGEWNGDTYTNDFIGIKFNLPKNWHKATDEEIARTMNIGQEMLNDDQQKLAELAQKTTLYCMVANDPSTGASVSIIIEKPTLKVTPDFYLTSVKQQLEAVESIAYKIGDIHTTKISNSEFKSIDAEATMSGITVKQSYYSKSVDDYMVSMIITTTQDGQLDQIIKCFE